MKVKNWDKWQTYRKDRGTPPWIKVYRNLFTNPEWVSLSDSEKGQLISIWLLAADKKGEIPSNPEVIKKMCMLDSVPNLNKFIDLKFLVTRRLPSGDQVVDKVASIGCQHDAPETETETETETDKKNLFVEDSIEFRLARKLYLEIKKNNPNHKKPNSQAWAKHIDLMIRIDKRNPKHIARVIEWAQKDEFWKANILSTASLRKQFDRLVIKMNTKKPNEPKQPKLETVRAPEGWSNGR